MRLIITLAMLAIVVGAVLWVRQTRLRSQRREALRTSREVRDRVWQEAQARQRQRD